MISLPMHDFFPDGIDISPIKTIQVNCVVCPFVHLFTHSFVHYGENDHLTFLVVVADTVYNLVSKFIPFLVPSCKLSYHAKGYLLAWEYNYSNCRKESWLWYRKKT
jgi:hypothetical protein